MNKIKILIIIIVITIIITIIGIFLYTKNINKSRLKLVKNIINAKSIKKISSNKIDLPITNKGLGFTLNLWIYVDNWDYNYDQNKYIIKWHNCNIWLSKKDNNLNISVPVFNKTNPEIITYKKIKLQKWINIIIILDNRHLDLWINGKLFNSKYLSNVPNLINNSLEITPMGGFSGYIYNIIYYSYPLNYSSFLGKNTIKSLVSNKPKSI
jgi:hypothetical protein